MIHYKITLVALHEEMQEQNKRIIELSERLDKLEQLRFRTAKAAAKSGKKSEIEGLKKSFRLAVQQRPCSPQATHTLRFCLCTWSFSVV